LALVDAHVNPAVAAAAPPWPWARRLSSVIGCAPRA
jgi:hypothetical protein